MSVFDNVKNVLRDSLRRKFQSHNPEPSVMPFHTRLLGSDRMALFSFIHSLNTNFGTTIFEPVAKILAEGRFASAELQQTAGTKISSESQNVIQNIIDELSSANAEPDKEKEISLLRAAANIGEMKSVKFTKVDLKLMANDGKIYLIDIKTAKPNAGGFKEFKRTLLEWTATVLADNPNAEIFSMIAIPYNPYTPKPYNRWTMRGMIDIKKELMVAEEFWDFVGGEGAYQNLLKIFEEVGIELRPEIDEYFSRYGRK